MSRRCACHDWMEMLRADPRLRTMSLGARMLWLHLVDSLSRLPEPGVFVLGSRVGSNREIALLVSATETEVETHLETLLETHLVTRRESDGALMIAMPVAAARTSVNRENGGKGGRPRRGETAESAYRRRQGNLTMAITGGKTETQETELQTDAGENPRARGLTCTLTKETTKPPDILVFGNELAELAGLDPARGMFDFIPLKTWLDSGASADLIRETITAVAARPSYRAANVKGLSYFNGAIADALRAAPRLDPAREARAKEYNDEFDLYVANGCRGTPPVFGKIAVAS